MNAETAEKEKLFQSRNPELGFTNNRKRKAPRPMSIISTTGMSMLTIFERMSCIVSNLELVRHLFVDV